MVFLRVRNNLGDIVVLAAFPVLDPVLGDNGRMYVSESISSVMRDRLLPLADMITPNQFELGYVTGTDATRLADVDSRLSPLVADIPHLLCRVLADMVPESVEQCFSCMEALHHMGPRFVVVTSVDFNSGAASEDKCKNLQLLVSFSCFCSAIFLVLVLAVVLVLVLALVIVPVLILFWLFLFLLVFRLYFHVVLLLFYFLLQQLVYGFTCSPVCGDFL